jgi:TRAP-type C4-dicarboxylate transport system permease small subunit
VTYSKSQQRKARACIFLGWALGILSLSIFATALVKSAYYGCSPDLKICALVIVPVKAAYQYAVMRWFWAWVPDAPNGLWWISLLSPAGALATFYLIFSIYLTRKGRALRMLVKEARQDAEKRRLSDSYYPTNTQTIGPINAGEM